MEPAEYEYMFRLEDNLWWYVGMRRIVFNLLRRHLGSAGGLRVLDAGCGTGGSLPLLERFGQVTAFDFYPPAASLCLTRRRGRILIASVDAIPLADATFDLVTALDVVCQLRPPAEATALQELARVARPGGSVLVRVPAYQSLYGPHDVTVQTQHRYTVGELKAKMAQAGLEPVWASYANTLLFPVAAARRLVAKLRGDHRHASDVRPVAEPLNRALTAVLSLEAEALKRTPLPFGLSVIALARKP